jgi:hypothetical protein
MASKKEISPQPDSAVGFEITPSAERYAGAININLTATVAQRWNAVVTSRESEQGYFAAQGLLLLSLKQEMPKGEFLSKLKSLEYEERQAQRAMSYARFVFSRSDKEQAELLKLPHTKVCALAASDPAVVDELLQEDGSVGVHGLSEISGRALLSRIKELEKANNDLQGKLGVKQAKKDVDARLHAVTPDIPYQITDIRRETAALTEQARLAVVGLNDIAPMLQELQGVKGCDDWINPSLLQGFVAMRALHAQLSVQLGQWAESFGLNDDAMPPPESRAYYRPAEAAMVATHFNTLAQAHLQSATKRAKVAANNSPEKFGRKFKIE